MPRDDNNTLSNLYSDIREIREDVSEIKVAMGKYEEFQKNGRWIIGIILALSGLNGSKTIKDFITHDAKAETVQQVK